MFIVNFKTLEWKFKNKTTNMFFIGLNMATVMN